MNWQPIETAPVTPPDKEPEEVLLWLPGGGFDHKGCCAFGRCYKYSDGNVRAVASGFLGFEITHWMPLPEPPDSPS